MVNRLKDVTVTVSFAVDEDVTLEEAMAFAAEAIAAKLDYVAELAQWGDTAAQRFYYNGMCAEQAHWG